MRLRSVTVPERTCEVATPCTSTAAAPIRRRRPLEFAGPSSRAILVGATSITRPTSTLSRTWLTTSPDPPSTTRPAMSWVPTLATSLCGLSTRTIRSTAITSSTRMPANPLRTLASRETASGCREPGLVLRKTSSPAIRARRSFTGRRVCWSQASVRCRSMPPIFQAASCWPAAKISRSIPGGIRSLDFRTTRRTVLESD